jgi:hypothetical protein
MSKGSKQRPFDYEAFAQNYDRIFGKPRKQIDALQKMVDNAEELGLYEEDESQKRKTKK